MSEKENAVSNIAVVILAAGEGKRFGSPKQLALWRGLPLLQHAISLASSLGIKPCIALGAHRALIETSADISLDSCHIVTVDRWVEGISASIKETLNMMLVKSPSIKGVIYLLADQPLLKREDLEKIYTIAVSHNYSEIVCSEYSFQEAVSLGVPAYFPSQHFRALLSLEGDQGAKKVILANKHQIVRLKGALIDIDTVADLNLMRNGDVF